MPATTTIPTEPAESAAESVAEVFLAPRVVDEAAFYAFSERLRELVDRADAAQASLGGVTGQGAEVLTSLEAVAHTQQKKSAETLAMLADIEKRLKELKALRATVAAEAEKIQSFEQRSAASLAALTEAGATVTGRAEEAGSALRSVIEDADAKTDELRGQVSMLIQPRLEGLEDKLAKLGSLTSEAARAEDEFRSLVERSAEETQQIKDAEKELDGLRHQTDALLSAMRSTILECAEARDSADARFERLKGLTESAGTVLATVESRVKQAEKRAGKIGPAERDLEPVIADLERRVMSSVKQTIGAQVRDAAAALTPEPAEAPVFDEAELEARVIAVVKAHVNETVQNAVAAAIDAAPAPSAPAALPPAIAERIAALEVRLDATDGAVMRTSLELTQRAAAPAAAAAPSVEQRLEEIQTAIEMLSGITHTLTATPVSAAADIAPAETPREPVFEFVTEPTPVRTRRVVALPTGAPSGPGETPAFITLWSWTEG